MKGRFFITIMALATMLVSFSAKAEKVNIPFDVKGGTITYGNTIYPDITYEIAGVNKGDNNGSNTKSAEIDCVHPHGGVQFLNAAYPIVAAFVAADVYKTQISADREVKLAQWVGTYDKDTGFHSPGYFDSLSTLYTLQAGSPWMMGGGYGGAYSGYGYGGNWAAGYGSSRGF